ncbi:hypothetical protein IQ231_20930 [Cuspidothrix issatschenkoi LEGE 03284]|uniref:hypothetical protein n=1 Tax=Cuspidothrix issatschenkoi TaxID=230752 RepID=UPI0018826E51|nr:hypothetical protein [Cuspidothrix issatschenkoi]MBE9234060.1 hypothetical protein [Cuspidothrix issatschenkoi LEGE 03284]
MSIWILTTGNSDVQLKHNYNANKWQKFYRNIRSELSNHLFEPSRLKNALANEPYTVPARVMGMVYSSQLNDESVFNDLHFPLLDTFTDFLTKLDKKEQPNQIIVITTNQEKAFDDDDKKNNKCPYWQDTYTLQPILEKYFEQDNKYPELKTGEHIHYLPLEAEPEKEGLDDWNKCLELVDKLFQKKEITSIDKDANIFVSHQAGTPAISSAVQFTSLAKFEKQVQFLVSNEYKDREAIPIPSSKYLRGIQIQKAKQLIESGLPGAALNILDTIDIDENVKEELIELVRFFNIETELDKSRKIAPEMLIKDATKRVVNALELVTCYFQEQSYIQGIALLAAAHETFLKAAIMKELSNKCSYFKLSVNGNSKQFQVTKVIEWTRGGLGFAKDPKDKEVWQLDNHLKRLLGITNIRNIKSYKLDILKQLSFPTNDPDLYEKLNKGEHGNFSVIGSNTGMLAWLKQLPSNFTSWDLMEFIGQYNREFEDDRRNQLMHNLVGAKPKEVIKYLLGNQDDLQYTDDNAGVMKSYEEQVKKPFLEQIKKLGLPYEESNLRIKLQEIADKLR